MTGDDLGTMRLRIVGQVVDLSLLVNQRRPFSPIFYLRFRSDKTLLACGLTSIPRRVKKLPNLLFRMLRNDQTQQNNTENSDLWPRSSR